MMRSRTVDPARRRGKALLVVAAVVMALASIFVRAAPAADSMPVRFNPNAVSLRQLCPRDPQETAPNECLRAGAPLATCIPASVRLTQACGQPQCPAGQVPCSVTVGASGQLCWICCPG